MTLLAPSFRSRAWREAVYALAALPFGVAATGTIVTLYSSAIGLLVIGLPFLLVALAVGRIGASVERRWLAWASGEQLPASPPIQIPPEGNLWRRWIRPLLLSGARWRETVYLVVLLPAGVLHFTVATALWSIAVSFSTVPLWGWAADDMPFPLAVAVFVVGLVFLVLAPLAVHALNRTQVRLARALLGPTRGELERERDAAVRTVNRDRRQLERDLHDGAQARLMALAVELGRARERLDGDGSREEAAALVRAAHEQAKRAIVEVRDLVRGIHPAILTDRGLDAALSSLAASSPARVTIDADPDLRAPDEVEGAAYFVAAEALTNIAKHSGAAHAHVSVRHTDGMLVIEVRDDGAGGAEALPGSGLAGLAERVDALGGRFELVSPPGGPTVVKAELPCG